MEIVMLDDRLPRMANILFFQPKVVNGWIEVAEARKKMVSWNNYCPPPKNIIQKYRPLEDYFPQDPGGQTYECSSDHASADDFVFLSIH